MKTTGSAKAARVALLACSLCAPLGNQFFAPAFVRLAHGFDHGLSLVQLGLADIRREWLYFLILLFC